MVNCPSGIVQFRKIGGACCVPGIVLRPQGPKSKEGFWLGRNIDVCGSCAGRGRMRQAGKREC